MKAAFWMAVLCAALAPAAAAQQRIDRPGTVAHVEAATGFPERVGGFRLANVYRFDREGRNVSASYNMTTPEGRVLITVYIYPSPSVVAGPGGGESAEVARAMLCRDEFEQVKAAIVQQHRDPDVVDNSGATAQPGVPAAHSLRAAYRFRADFDDKQQEVRSEAWLYCAVGGRWQVKYRLTAPVAAETAAAALEAFIRDGPWPGRGDQSGQPTI